MIVASVERLTFTPGERTVPALDDVSLRIRAGEVVLVQGPSGSGKTTLLRALAGLVPHFHGGRFRGQVLVGGLDTRRVTPGELARHVGCVFQDPETQAVRSTVRADVAFGPENLGVAADDIAPAVERALQSVGVAALGDRDIATLSGGERQRAAIAGVLATNPRLLLLDEPTSQLDPSGVAHLDALLRALAARGVAVVLTEHHAHRLGIHPDRVLTLHGGRLVASPPTSPPEPPSPMEPGAPSLQVAGVHATYGGGDVLAGCDLTLHARTITALQGPNGSGKSTLLRAIAGLHPVTAGAIALTGRVVTDLSPEDRVPTLGLLPQDGGRRLINERVRDELASGLHGLGRVERERRLERVADELDLAQLSAAHPLDLSVGERERVALGVVLAMEPRVIMLDEPTRGMDGERRALLGSALRGRAAEGAAVLVVTHDPQFALAVADRHVAMELGVVVDAAHAVPA